MLWDQPPSETWVHSSVRVAPSAIEGGGLFSVKDITAGTTVLRLGGQLLSTAALAERLAAANADPAAPFVDTITVFEDAHLVLPLGSMAHFGNHSCDPNLWLVGPYEIGARRHIDADEELTVDYGTLSGAPGFSMRCRCAATDCRSEITSEDWLNPGLQVRYGHRRVPALLDRVRGP